MFLRNRSRQRDHSLMIWAAATGGLLLAIGGLCVLTRCICRTNNWDDGLADDGLQGIS